MKTSHWKARTRTYEWISLITKCTVENLLLRVNIYFDVTHPNSLSAQFNSTKGQQVNLGKYRPCSWRSSSEPCLCAVKKVSGILCKCVYMFNVCAECWPVKEAILLTNAAGYFKMQLLRSNVLITKCLKIVLSKNSLHFLSFICF